ncbi:hypothetical protein JYU34_021608 [Plutella xylostella]|uniref:Fatty acyl-CoA reductase n=1 Tax=Plutella xylostella TaxID=51655 RepID=A0ABQ7PRB2_PLUXY|nr:hypothetical protein JYU34_021608 [Plutella xylostella]
MVARGLSSESEGAAGAGAGAGGARIPAFYAGKSILITGATGFMGKVLIERLLSTCPDVGLLYLLMREKKDQPPSKRLAELKKSQVFDVLLSAHPERLDKLRALSGDTARPALGLTPDAVRSLQQVSIVFHVAATLKFDEGLRKATDENLRSVTRLLEICDQLPHIDAVVHVSTAYCMAELAAVEERVYPPPCAREQLDAVIDQPDEEIRQELTKKLLGDKPNTYTFTKAMAEHAVVQHQAKYPVAIFRPTIVISSVRTPVPGWIENLNGPSGVIVAAGKGLLHAFRCGPDLRADLLPVDIAIDTMIAVAWDIATHRTSSVRVYNATTYDNPTTWRQFELNVRRNVVSEPFDNAFWYPFATTFSNKFMHRLTEWSLQTVPLHAAQYICKFLNLNTPVNLIVVSQKLKAMNSVLEFFSMREWRFHNEHVKQLRARMTAADRDLYNLDCTTIDWDEHFKNFVIGTRRYLLKEKDEDIAKAKKHIKKMYILHTGAKMLLLLFFTRLLLQKSEVARTFIYGTLRMLLSLTSAIYQRVFTSTQIAT